MKYCDHNTDDSINISAINTTELSSATKISVIFLWTAYVYHTHAPKKDTFDPLNGFLIKK